MFSIGNFARIGRVSVRMLRHYDAIGLLRPAHVDPATGYRTYEAAQLPRLNRVIALRDLGFGLAQIGSVLDDDKVSVEELHGMLRLRLAELEAQVAADRSRLSNVLARIRTIEREGVMPADVVVKSVPSVRVAELSGLAESYAPEHIGPVVSPLFGDLIQRLEGAGVQMTGPSIAYYEQEGDAIRVHAAFPVAAEPDGGHDFQIVDLPAIEQAATTLHRGPMDFVDATGQQLARWIEENGYKSVGFMREVYIRYGMGDPETWITELQEEVIR